MKLGEMHWTDRTGGGALWPHVREDTKRIGKQGKDILDIYKHYGLQCNHRLDAQEGTINATPNDPLFHKLTPHGIVRWDSCTRLRIYLKSLHGLRQFFYGPPPMSCVAKPCEKYRLRCVN